MDEEDKGNPEEESKFSNIKLMSGNVIQSEKDEKHLLPEPYYVTTYQEPQVSVQSPIKAKTSRKTTDDNRSSASEEILDNSK